MTTTTPSNKSMVSSINNFVKTFLESDNVSAESWASPVTQKQLKAVLSGKEQKKQKGVEKADKPKKAKSSYLYFCSDERTKIKQEHPELSSVQITVLLGKHWKELKDDKSRASLMTKYEKMASVDNERYAKEKKAKSSSVQEKPKKAKSSYLLFCEKMRPVVKVENPNLSAKEIISELGRRWQAQKSE
jgi:hypothetical protein